MNIAENIKQIQNCLPEHVTLVAVSKTKPKRAILEAYEAGQRIFGENKIQEMAEKHAELPKDIEWHMIGHVQRNKVKYMASFVQLIHGVENFKLLQEINKQAAKHQRRIDCLLQIKIASEDSKFGMSAIDARNILESETFKSLEHIKITGLMGMASFTDDSAQVKKEFELLKNTFDALKTYKSDNCDLETLSMGMSGDLHLAIKAGSTMVRVGSSIFGMR